MNLSVKTSHYDYLDRHLGAFFERVGLPAVRARGMGVAHGDKCYGYREGWDRAGIPFAHGVSIYLLSYVWPFTQEVRETPTGWVAPQCWVLSNYDRFKGLLPAVEGA